MKKVGFFRSIHLKFVLIYVLLILVAMQIIGVYFVDGLEDKLKTNFENSLRQQVNILSFSIEEEMVKERDKNSTTVEEDINEILKDKKAGDIQEIRVIDSGGKIIGTSKSDDDGIVGKRTTDKIIKISLQGTEQKDVKVVPKTGKRIWILSSPIKSKGETIGAIYLEADIETVFEQIKEINKIFATGTAIALGITAILGILLAQTITRPMSDMRRQALAMAKGNFSRKVKVYGYDEIGQLAITFNNLTKKLQDAQSSTEGERRKLSSVLSYMTDGVIATDRKGRIILINEQAAMMLNVSRETVISQEIVPLLGLEDQYSFEDLLEETESVILDNSTSAKDLILRANFSVIQRETGFVNGLITVLHDITEQEKIEEERREFVANVSHELRTPLTTMRSYLEALSEGAWRDENIAPNFLKVTQKETERMIRLVNDLLQLSKLDSKDYKITKSWVDFTEFFHHIIDRFEMSKDQNVFFVRELPKKSIFVEIDEDKITQIIDNIISNALKYSPEGGKIRFRVRELDHEIEVSIKDQGMGIPKENVVKVFERFYRVDRARSRKLGGTGLGLAIAKEMVTAHNGKIWAESEEGKGTAIFFSLPYDPEQEDEWS
ncbi:two-component system sensor histidine kinase VicK [Peribacillus deserti]|uniref:histidine kinase n=1 Tax=Peribacillus deserti TaxID=673318 RepID=A0ABS2QM61_9BACI|nr:cell wall metabolism sensor histidine kinase WalK [Peribacillus deserti]MBM7693548.1 two-component system sensor histidine kinase VicK [Peribacillus deserti]